MNTIAAFALGYIAKAAAGAMLGKFVAYGLNEVENWPTVLHYLNSHAPKRSVACVECENAGKTPVDTIT